MTNEQIMWAVLAVWGIFVLIMGYQLIFGKSVTSQLLPSGNTADPNPGGGA
jgi:hypothetical protein